MLPEYKVSTGVVVADDIPCVSCHILAVLRRQILNCLFESDVCHYLTISYRRIKSTKQSIYVSNIGLNKMLEFTISMQEAGLSQFIFKSISLF